MDFIESIFHDILVAIVIFGLGEIALLFWRRAKFPPPPPTLGGEVSDVAGVSIRWWLGFTGLSVLMAQTVNAMYLSSRWGVHVMMWLAVLGELVLTCWAFHVRSPVEFLHKWRAKSLGRWDWVMPLIHLAYPLAIIVILVWAVYGNPQIRKARRMIADADKMMAEMNTVIVETKQLQEDIRAFRNSLPTTQPARP